jgi:hypothetical protein
MGYKINFDINVYVQTQGATEHCLQLWKYTYNEDAIAVIRSVSMINIISENYIHMHLYYQ